MRLGLFGGTFDPIHLGHLILAEVCREVCSLDCVWFVVAGQPPHKQRTPSPIADRLEMARIAIAGHPAFEVSEIEARRPGPHYSVDTLEAIHRERPGDELFFLVGSDSLAELSTWREPGRILALATLIVANRSGFEGQTEFSLPTGARPIRQVTIPQIGIASRELRRRVAEGRSIRYQVPRGVEAFVEAQGLYRGT